MATTVVCRTGASTKEFTGESFNDDFQSDEFRSYRRQHLLVIECREAIVSSQ
jgi:hypothetical protein